MKLMFRGQRTDIEPGDVAIFDRDRVNHYSSLLLYRDNQALACYSSNKSSFKIGTDDSEIIERVAELLGEIEGLGIICLESLRSKIVYEFAVKL